MGPRQSTPSPKRVEYQQVNVYTGHADKINESLKEYTSSTTTLSEKIEKAQNELKPLQGTSSQLASEIVTKKNL